MLSEKRIPGYDNMSIRIIKILSDEQVLINVGSDDDLEIKDRLVVYAPGIEITDPFTKQLLGQLDYEKATIQIDEIYPKMAVCSSAELQMSRLTEQMSNALLVGRKRPLDVDLDELSPDNDDIDRTIRIGDYVKFKHRPKNK